MLTLPNILTIARILAVPALLGVFTVEGPVARWIVVGLFVAASLTDYLDGWIARTWALESEFGRVMDPIADKLLVAAALLLLLSAENTPLIAVGLILLREILISGLREGLAGRLVLPVSRLAKCKTASQMIAITVLLIGPLADTGGALPIAGECLLWVAAALTWITAFDYLRTAWGPLTRSSEANGS
jgi:cardiolipin synthase